VNKIEILNKYKDYLETRKLSINYYNIMRIFLNFLEEHKTEPEKVTQETITEFFKKNETYSISTRNQFIKAGRDFSKFLGIDNSEWAKIKLLKIEYKIPDFLSSKEIEEAKKYLKMYHSAQYSIPKIEALFSFLFATGVRKSELINLKRFDIDLENSKAKVYGKGRKERYVYFDKKTKARLEEFFMSENEETNAFNISGAQLIYMTKLLSKYLGKKVYLHLFRHSFAHRGMQRGIDLRIMSKILGHSSITTTMIYVNPSEEEIKDMYKSKMEDK